MYVRVYLLGPDGGAPRAIILRIGRSIGDHRTIGLSFIKPHFITWRHRRWTPEMEREALARLEAEQRVDALH